MISNYVLYVFLKEHGFGPWECFFCGGEVAYKHKDRSKNSLNIHHKDGDRTNNRPKNLKPVHQGCHTQAHWTGKKHSPESKEKMRQKQLNVFPSTETRRRIGASLVRYNNRKENAR